MAITYHLELDENDLGQLMDGLEQRAESWERTAGYLRSGFLDGDEVIEECSDPREADSIAAHYRSILQKLHTQREAQR